MAASNGIERGVHDDAPVLGVVDHVGQLVGRQPDVQRVQHRAHGTGWPGRPPGGPGCSSRRCPTRSPSSIPRRLQGALASFSARLGHLGEGGRAVPARLNGDDCAVAVHLLPVAEDVADQERCVLHGAFHGPVWPARPGRAHRPVLFTVGGSPGTGRGPPRPPWRAIPGLIRSVPPSGCRTRAPRTPPTLNSTVASDDGESDGPGHCRRSDGARSGNVHFKFDRQHHEAMATHRP